MKGRHTKGLSTVLSTLILFSVIFVLVITASNMANDAVNGQIENAQFDQAQNVLMAMDKSIKKIIYEPGSTASIKTSFWTVLPQFTPPDKKLNLTILDSTGKKLKALDSTGNKILPPPVNVTIVSIKGSPRTSVATNSNLVGNGDLILTDISKSIGRVQVYQSSGAWTTLDYSRVSCINTGTNEYYNATTTSYETYNYLEITIVKIEFKDIEFQEQAYYIVKNQGLDQYQYIISKENNFKIVVEESGVQRRVDTRTLVQLGGNTSYKTLIKLVIVDIEISLRGGI